MGQKKKKKKKILAKERQPTTVERFLLEIEQKGIFIFVCKGGNYNEERILFLAAKIQEELGSLHVLPDFLLLHAMIAPPPVAGKEGAGITAALILQRTSGSLYFPPQVGIKEPFLPGISHPRSKGPANAGYLKKGQN
jgi:hypothetical protein